MHYWDYVTWKDSNGVSHEGRVTRTLRHDVLVREHGTFRSVLVPTSMLTSIPAPPPRPLAETGVPALPHPWAAAVALLRAARDHGPLHAAAVADYPESRRLRAELIKRGYLIETPDGDRLTALAEKHL